MKMFLSAASAVALAASVSLAPALADGPKASGNNGWPGMSLPSVMAMANPSPAALRPKASGSNLPVTAAATPHWEWQYHYVGHHAMWRPGWVRVE
jgi:hypothetical protein